MIDISYTVTLRSPLRVATGIGRAGWLDNTVTRNSTGHPVIPGSSIKGRSRATAYRLAQGLGVPSIHSPAQETEGCTITAIPPCMICRIFGAAQWPGLLSFADSNLDPRLQDLLSSLDHSPGRETFRPEAGLAFGRLVRSNTAIDRRRRVALPGHLFTYEAIDSSVSFIGRIAGDIRALSADYREIALLVAALESITHLGGAKGRGMGRCTITVDQIMLNNNPIDRADLNQALSTIGGAS